MAGWGTILQVAGAAEQDISAIIGPFWAANAETGGINHATDAIKQQYGQTQDYMGQAAQGAGTGYNAAVAAQQPYAQAGAPAAQQYANLAEKGFSFNPGDLTNDPGYQFREEQGAAPLTTGASASGNMLSGATQQALARYNQNFASNEYNNAYQRAQGAYTTNLAALGGAAGMGQQAANQLGGYGMGYGNTLANIGAQQAGYANQYGSNLANLSLMQGNVNAGLATGEQSAAFMQGQHLQDIGSGNMGGGGGGGQGGGGMMSMFGGQGGAGGGGGMAASEGTMG